VYTSAVTHNAFQWARIPPKLPSPLGGSKHPSNTWFFGPTQVTHPNSILIGSAVLAELTNVTNRDRHTDIQTYHATLSPCRWYHAMQVCTRARFLDHFSVPLTVLPFLLYVTYTMSSNNSMQTALYCSLTITSEKWTHCSSNLSYVVTNMVLY